MPCSEVITTHHGQDEEVVAADALQCAREFGKLAGQQLLVMLGQPGVVLLPANDVQLSRPEGRELLNLCQ